MPDLRETRLIYRKKDFYSETPITDKSFLGFLVDRRLFPDPTDIFVIVEKRHVNRPFVLAHDLYGDEGFAWIIIRMNMSILIDPIRDMKENIVLRVPSVERATALMT